MKRIICAALLCLFLHSNMVVSAQESCHWVEPIVNVTGPVVVRLFHLEPNPIVIGEKVEVVLMLYNWLPESVVAEYVIEVLDHARNSIGVVTRQKVQVGGREVRSILHSRIPTEGAETFEGFLAVQVRGGGRRMQLLRRAPSPPRGGGIGGATSASVLQSVLVSEGTLSL